MLVTLTGSSPPDCRASMIASAYISCVRSWPLPIMATFQSSVSLIGGLRDCSSDLATEMRASRFQSHV